MVPGARGSSGDGGVWKPREGRGSGQLCPVSMRGQGCEARWLSLGLGGTRAWVRQQQGLFQWSWVCRRQVRVGQSGAGCMVREWGVGVCLNMGEQGVTGGCCGWGYGRASRRGRAFVWEVTELMTDGPSAFCSAWGPAGWGLAGALSLRKG